MADNRENDEGERWWNRQGRVLGSGTTSRARQMRRQAAFEAKGGGKEVPKGKGGGKGAPLEKGGGKGGGVEKGGKAGEKGGKGEPLQKGAGAIMQTTEAGSLGHFSTSYTKP
jgi:hypothetical protein